MLTLNYPENIHLFAVIDLLSQAAAFAAAKNVPRVSLEISPIFAGSYSGYVQTEDGPKVGIHAGPDFSLRPPSKAPLETTGPSAAPVTVRLTFAELFGQIEPQEVTFPPTYRA